MRIELLIDNAYVGGGTARTTLATASGLAARGHEVEIVSLVRRRERVSFPVDPRVRIRPLVDEYTWRKREPHPRLVRSARARLANRRSRVGHPGDRRTVEWSLYTDQALVRHLATARAGILIGTRPALNLAVARFARNPRIVRIGQDHVNLRSYRPGLRAEIAARYPGGLDALVTLTDRDADEYRELLGPGPRVLSIPNAVPDTGDRRAALDAKLVISGGRLVEQKGYDRLLPVWAQIAPQRPDWQLHLYGGGAMEQRLHAMVRELGIEGSAIIHPRTPELFDRLEEASIFVMTSRREGFPMVLLEAMSIGLPVVAYDCPTGPRELVTDGAHGYVVPDGDGDALAARIRELMDDPAARKRMGANGPAKAAEFDPGPILDRWERLFAELLAARRGR
jgi:glycosyltransferase involved in cell wall biosynthesis